MLNNYIPERALFIYAHPDDIEFGVAGTAAKWAQAGAEVTYILITDGNIGSHDPEMTPEKLAEIRRREQTESAEVVGAKCVFLGYPDGRLVPDLGLRKDLTREIRRFKPNVVVCGDPTIVISSSNRINHPDHRAAATAAIDAVFPTADSPLIFPELVTEGFPPHKVNYVLLSYGRDADLYIDITATIDLKIEALRRHTSQIGDWDPSERLRDWSAEVGKKAGFAHAESYRLITLNPLEAESE
ncbi:MAG TPA: PIG-L deacetylase family protein [Anaerolineae bacterium]|nr:PIG-L deacetylase family protein [Anaerolineae bacterium]